MGEEDFLTNVARMVAAELYFLAGMQCAREMCGKSYFALGVAEKIAVDQMVFGTIAANYQSATPENLKRQTTQPQAGFQVPEPKTS